MAKYKVAVVVGSLRKDSINLKLAKALAKLGQGAFDTQFVTISDFPLFSQDLEGNVPAAVTRVRNEIKAADAVLFVTPEYNRGMPGPLKNAIDWCSRPYGQNAFAGKPAALCGASVGAIGSACAQNNLKPILNYLDLDLMGQPELYLHFTDGLIDADGNVSNDGTKKFLQGYVDKFAAWIASHAAAGSLRATGT